MKKAIAIILSIMLVLAITLPAAAISSIAVKSIKLNISKITLEIGQTSNLKIAFTPANTSQKVMTYVTSNKNVATVDRTGKITGVSKGTTTITVYTLNKKIFATCNVTISQKSGIDISKKVELKMYTFGAPPQDLSIVNTQINSLIQKDLNCTVKITPSGVSDWQTKYNLLLTSGQPVDIIWTASWNNYATNALKGAYTALDNLLPTAAPKLLQAFSKEAWDSTKIGGKILCIPALNPNWGAWGFAYREDLRLKYNLPEVKDMASIEAYLTGIKKNEPSMLPMLDTSEAGIEMSYQWQNHIFNRFGATQCSYGIGVKMDKPREIVKYFETPEFAEYCKMIKRWVTNGLAQNSILSSKEDGWQGLRTGKYASSASGTDANRLNNNVIISATAEHPDWKFGYLNWGVMSKIAYAAHPTFSTIGLSRISKNPERALAFIEKVYTDKALNRLYIDGIEGVHYKVDDQGYYVSLNNPAKPGFPQSALGAGWSYNKDFMVYSRAFDFVKKQYDLQKQYGVANYFDAFPEDSSTYTAERAALSQVFTQYGMPLFAGIVPDVDAAIKTLVEKTKAAGGDKVYTEFTKQWNKYLDGMGVK